MTNGLRHLAIGSAFGIAFLASAVGTVLAAEPLPLDIGGDFTLVDQGGRIRHSTEFRGRLVLVWFGYTECPHSCGMALNSISAALDELGARSGEIVPLFITVDPEHDTPSRIAAHLSHFHPGFIGLTGDPGKIMKVEEGFQAFGRPVEDPGAFKRLFEHTTFIYLMGRQGEPLSLLPATLPAERIAAILRSHL
jgi:protein SCO1/2